MMTGIDDFKRIWRRASMPFISGISTSMVMTSGLSCSALAMASRPLVAVSITRKRASRWMWRVIAFRMKLKSSTTRTRMGWEAGCCFSIGTASLLVS